MDALTFANPGWLHLWWVALAGAILLVWLVRNQHAQLDRLVASSLRSSLVHAPSRASRWWRIALLSFAAAAMTVGLARPQMGYEVVQTNRAGAAIMICLDVSRSMLAEDTAPNRLARAKAEIRDLLPLLDGDQVGLIAFAGRASVLSPLTPDFGFLRLALDDATANSVILGGTRLEEPIRKAVDGFAGTTGVSRSIILITDGEDHDSYVKEAATHAAERGVRILAIGFGDEAGSEIRITDPKTGVATLLTDSQGKPVSSRLDGNLLREIALSTEGAYIPAGTGTLDLSAIYREHIAPLTRASLDSGSQTIRHDLYQWAILAALFGMFGAVLATSLRHRTKSVSGSNLAVVLTVISIGTLATDTETLRAQTNISNGVTASGAANAASTMAKPSSGVANESNKSADKNSTSEAGPEQSLQQPLPEDARDAYNQGVLALQALDLDRAERMLQHAISLAETDEAVRFQSMFNLGWVAVRRAEKQLEEEPQTALGQLHNAADRWRRALDLRPRDTMAEQNLAAIVTRALALSDQLAAKRDQSLERLLTKAIAAQREVVTARRNLASERSTITSLSRKALRQMASASLKVADDVQRAVQLTAKQLAETQANAAQSQPGASPSNAPHGTPGDADKPLSEAALQRMATHLQNAQQRIVSSRSALRRKQSQRAFRTASVALIDLRRARAQSLALRERVELIISEQSALQKLTSSSVAASMRPTATKPDWLDFAYLHDTQKTVAEHTAELVAVEPDSPAIPHLRTANAEMKTASFMLQESRFAEALPVQLQALRFLALAREHLLDIRGLVDLAVTHEEQIAAALESNSGKAQLDDAWSAVSDAHEENVERMSRLGIALSEATAAALKEEQQQQTSSAQQSKPASPTQPKPLTQSETPTQAAYSREQLEQGYELWVKARNAMHRTSDQFDAMPSDTRPHAARLNAVTASVTNAITRLHELQQLFFNLIEHLRDVAKQQQSLNDDSRAAGDAGDGPAAAQTMSLRQSGLQPRTAAIGQALNKQAQEASNPSRPASGANPPPTGPQQTISPEKYAEAATLVNHAAEQMTVAAEVLKAEASESSWSEAGAVQNAAHTKLQDALALLVPPQQQQQQQQQQQDQQQNQDENKDDDQQKEQEPQQHKSERNPTSGLLQGVRDREAERREARRRQRANYAPVDKDW